MEICDYSWDYPLDHGQKEWLSVRLTRAPEPGAPILISATVPPINAMNGKQEQDLDILARAKSMLMNLTRMMKDTYNQPGKKALTVQHNLSMPSKAPLAISLSFNPEVMSENDANTATRHAIWFLDKHMRPLSIDAVHSTKYRDIIAKRHALTREVRQIIPTVTDDQVWKLADLFELHMQPSHRRSAPSRN